MLRKIIWLAVLLLAFTSPVVRAADPPPQPASLSVVHRSGQTFLTWPERADLSGERYRIYRSDRPIDPASLDPAGPGAATLLYEVPEGSALFFANRYADYATPPKWAYRYAERLRIPAAGADDAAELPAGTGLLVWTTAAQDLAVAAHAYYAVTTVTDGVENRSDFVANVAGPVSEAVARPAPVRFAGPNGWLVYIQYRDLRNWNPTFNAPNPLNSYYGFKPTDYGVPGAIQYAYDVPVHIPTSAACGGALPASLPLYLSLHAWSGDHYGPAGQPANWCAYILAPIDQSETWWFGFARSHDYRQGGRPAAGDVIVNYTEQRVLDMLDYLLRNPPGPAVDPQRIYVDGHSMGGGGSLALALRYPDVFAAAYASKPVTNHRTSGWTFSTIPRWGPVELNLPVAIDAPNSWAEHLKPTAPTGVWDWQNLQADVVRRSAETRTPINLDLGINDASIPWPVQGAPMLAQLEASRQPWSAGVSATGHNWGAYAGLSPDYARDVSGGTPAAGAPFSGLRAVRDETVPAFSAVSTDPPIPPTDPTSYHQSLYWSSFWAPWDGAPVDTPAYWRMSICTVANPAQPSCGSGTDAKVNITLRRLQAFVVAPGEEYTWQAVAISSGRRVQSGKVVVAPDGTLTVPAVIIPAAGIRLAVHSAAFRPAAWLPLVAH